MTSGNLALYIGYIGKKINGWIILDVIYDKSSGYLFKCQCDCGKIANCKPNNIIKGYSKRCRSCGAKHIKHGYCCKDNPDFELYDCLRQMKQRCYNSKHFAYKYYGAKGIKICDEWLNDFENFVKWARNNGYKEKLTIDRIDPDKDYCPENCRWATHKEQNTHLSRSIRNKTGYVGICKCAGENRYRSTCEGKALGRFSTIEEALAVRNKYIIDNKLDYPIQEYKGEIVSVNN